VSDNTFIADGVWLFDAWNSYFSNNYVNSKPLLYLDRQSDLLINESAGQVILINCVRVEVTEQEISNTTAGIILIVSDDCIIHKNILTTNKGYNLFLSNSKGNTIFENTMSTSSDSLTIYLSKENIVYKNIITDSERGIYLIDTQYNNISRNTIKNNRFEGIVLDNANNNSVSRNTIEKNGGRNQIFNPGGLGIFLYESSNNQIEYNNFLRNARDAYFGDSYSNIWEGNYWNRPRLFPKIIRGENDNFIFDKMFNFDWHPALEQNTIY
jgi:parallel beta-helix repeat protein